MEELIALVAPAIVVLFISAAIISAGLTRWKLAALEFLFCLIINIYFSIIPIPIYQKSDNSVRHLKVLSFNCNLFPSDSSFYRRLDDIKNLIKEEDADVVFLTENYYHDYDTLGRSLRTKYPYMIADSSSSGNCIYSKYQFYEDGMSKVNIPNNITCCQMLYKGTLIYVCGCHLSSNNYDKYGNYSTPEHINGILATYSYIKDIVRASNNRYDQAKLIVNTVSKNSVNLVLGDMNDVCGSPTLSILKSSKLKDAWWQGGRGYGATIHHPLPFRIDHIMYKGCRLSYIKKIDTHILSDHDALVAEFSIE